MAKSIFLFGFLIFEDRNLYVPMYAKYPAKNLKNKKSSFCASSDDNPRISVTEKNGAKNILLRIDSKSSV
jgi:hypothetical protein